MGEKIFSLRDFAPAERNVKLKREEENLLDYSKSSIFIFNWELMLFSEVMKFSSRGILQEDCSQILQPKILWPLNLLT